MNRLAAPPALQGLPVRPDRAPADYLVVQFPAGTRDFPHEVARELASLVEAEMVRVLDVVMIERDRDGRLHMFEPSELGSRAVLRRVESDLRIVLSDRDVEELGELLEPGRAAGLVVWEQLWSEPLVDCARRSGGRFLGAGHVGGPNVDGTGDVDDRDENTEETTT